MGTARLQPNTTQIPNYLLDEVMLDLSGSALKVILIIARQTYGWHKDREWIAYSQLIKKTGLHRESVAIGINELKKKGLIEITNEAGKILSEKNLSGRRKLYYKINYGNSDNKLKVKSENPTFKSRKIAPTKETNTKEIKTIPLRSSPLEVLTEEICQKIAERYRVKLSFVLLQREALVNYCESSGKTYRNYEAALRNFCLRDMKNMATRPRQGGVLDATAL